MSTKNTKFENFLKDIETFDKNVTSDSNMEVLIIDDDQWIHRIMDHYLKEWGFKTHSCYNAYDGIAYAVKNIPMLILLDIVMPEVNGDILLKMLKKIDATSEVPIVIMSANLSKLILGETYKNGAAGYISKPFTKDLVYDKLKSILLGETADDTFEDFSIEGLVD